MFDFCIANPGVFGSLTQNCLQLDKDKSIVSTFSVFLVDNYAVSTTQKGSYLECFKILKSSLMQVSWKQNLAPHI